MQELGLNAIRVYSVDNSAYDSFHETADIIAITENAWLFSIKQEFISSLMVLTSIERNKALTF